MEALVISACLYQKGCQESTDAYVKSNKGAEELIKNVEAIGDRIIADNRWIVYVGSPAYAFATGKPANIHLTNRWMLIVNAKEQALALQWSY